MATPTSRLGGSLDSRPSPTLTPDDPEVFRAIADQGLASRTGGPSRTGTRDCETAKSHRAASKAAAAAALSSGFAGVRTLDVVMANQRHLDPMTVAMWRRALRVTIRAGRGPRHLRHSLCASCPCHRSRTGEAPRTESFND